MTPEVCLTGLITHEIEGLNVWNLNLKTNLVRDE